MIVATTCATCGLPFDAEIRAGQQPPFYCFDHLPRNDRVRDGRHLMPLGWNVPADDPDAHEAFWQDLGRP